VIMIVLCRIMSYIELGRYSRANDLGKQGAAVSLGGYEVAIKRASVYMKVYWSD
jgi:hypothetical protein